MIHTHHEIGFLFGRLETPVAEFARRIDELQVDFLQSESLSMYQQRLKMRDCICKEEKKICVAGIRWLEPHDPRKWHYQYLGFVSQVIRTEIPTNGRFGHLSDRSQGKDYLSAD